MRKSLLNKENASRLKKRYPSGSISNTELMRLAFMGASCKMTELLERCETNLILPPTGQQQGAIHRLLLEMGIEMASQIALAGLAGLRIEDPSVINHDDINDVIADGAERIGVPTQSLEQPEK